MDSSWHRATAGLATAVAVVLGVSGAAAADPLRDWFVSRCEAGLPPDDPALAARGWLAALCEDTGARRAVEFRGAGRAQRLAMLAEDCRDWFARNHWRFSPRVTGNDAGWQAIVRSRCAAEAGGDLDRLTAILVSEPTAPVLASPSASSPVPPGHGRAERPGPALEMSQGAQNE